MAEIFGATLVGFFIQGGIYRFLLSKGLSFRASLGTSALIFLTTYIFVGAYGKADGGELNFGWSVSVGLPATIIISLFIIVSRIKSGDMNMGEWKSANWSLWPALETPEDATNDLAFLTKIIYVFAAVQFVLVTVLVMMQGQFTMSVADPFFIAAIAFTINRKRSRLAATVLLCYAFFIIFFTFMTRIGNPIEGSHGGRNIFLSMLFFYIALRALRSTIFYHRLSGTVIHWGRAWGTFGIACLYVLGVWTAIFYIAYIHTPSPMPVSMDEATYEKLVASLVMAVGIILFFLAGWRKLPGTGRLVATQSGSEVGEGGGQMGLSISALQRPEASRKDMPATEQPPPGYFLRHWRGEMSLARSFWVNYAAINIAAAYSFYLLDFFKMDHDLRFLAIVAAFCFVLFLAVFVWQAVGCWRSANSHVRSTGRQGWARTAQCLIVIGFFNHASQTVPITEEMLAIATGLDPYNNFEIKRHGDTAISINGSFGADMPEELRLVLDASPSIQWVALNSEGGRLGPAHDVGELIESHHLDTFTETGCYSSCFIAFMGGKRRALNDGAKIGVHRYNLRGASDELMYAAIAEDRQYFIARGVSQDFLDKAFSTPHDDMWFPTIEELIDSGVITHTFIPEAVSPDSLSID